MSTARFDTGQTVAGARVLGMAAAIPQYHAVDKTISLSFTTTIRPGGHHDH